MKKILSLTLVALFIFTFSSTVALAEETKSPNIQQSVEYLSDGSYFVTTIETNETKSSMSMLSRSASTKSGSKTSTYYGSNNQAIFYVRVNGTFTYNGSSSSATSASCTVGHYVSGSSSSGRGAYTSGRSAVAYATVKHGGLSTYRSVTLSCSANGTLS